MFVVFILVFIACVAPILDRIEPSIAERYVHIFIVIAFILIATSIFWLPFKYNPDDL